MVDHSEKSGLFWALFTSVILHQGHAFTCETNDDLHNGLSLAAAAVGATQVPVVGDVLNILTALTGLFGSYCTPESYLTQEDLRKWESEFVSSAMKGFEERMERMKEDDLAFERCKASKILCPSCGYDQQHCYSAFERCKSKACNKHSCGNNQHCFSALESCKSKACNKHSSFKDLIDHLTGLSRVMSDARFTHFDSEPHYWKMESFAAYGVMELNVLNLLINTDLGRNKKQHEKSYGRAFQYYLKRGTEYYQKYVLEQFPKEANGAASFRARKASLVSLQPVLLQWIKDARENSETRRRLKTVYSNLNLKRDIFPQIGVYQDLMPETISDNDWVALKCAKGGFAKGYEAIDRNAAWLSCHLSIDDDDWCAWRSCPALLANQGHNECLGERFRIQSIYNGQIEHGRKVAFKYWNMKDGSKPGHYWLSYKDAATHRTDFGKKPGWLDSLWVSQCPGATFSRSVINSCDKEVFTITHALKENTDEIIRNGDVVQLSADNLPNVDYWSKKLNCFIVKQNKQNGDKW